MRKNVQATINAFKAGCSYTDKTIRTDGQKIWSYQMLIAYRENGKIFITRDSPTKTTSSQVNSLIDTFPEHETF